jgi:hypothetical protein
MKQEARIKKQESDGSHDGWWITCQESRSKNQEARSASFLLLAS